jgi:predicted transcriptional regulator
MNNSNRPRIGGEATAIVQTLREFGRNQPVPANLVARSVGREEDEIRESLAVLAENGVVKLDKDGEVVTAVTLVK